MPASPPSVLHAQSLACLSGVSCLQECLHDSPVALAGCGNGLVAQGPWAETLGGCLIRIDKLLSWACYMRGSHNQSVPIHPPSKAQALKPKTATQLTPKSSENGTPEDICH